MEHKYVKGMTVDPILALSNVVYVEPAFNTITILSWSFFTNGSSQYDTMYISNGTCITDFGLSSNITFAVDVDLFSSQQYISFTGACTLNQNQTNVRSLTVSNQSAKCDIRPNVSIPCMAQPFLFYDINNNMFVLDLLRAHIYAAFKDCISSELSEISILNLEYSPNFHGIIASSFSQEFNELHIIALQDGQLYDQTFLFDYDWLLYRCQNNVSQKKSPKNSVETIIFNHNISDIIADVFINHDVYVVSGMVVVFFSFFGIMLYFSRRQLAQKKPSTALDAGTKKIVDIGNDIKVPIDGQESKGTLDSINDTTLTRYTDQFQERFPNTATLTFYNPKSRFLSLPGHLAMIENKDFTIGSKLADGGGGLVFHGNLLNNGVVGEHVAVKVIRQRSDEAFDFALKISCMQEIAIMGMLTDSAHFVKLLGFRMDPEPIMVLKFYKDGSLLDFINSPYYRDQDLAETWYVIVLSVLYDIASGLEELHGLGIVHNDIKPANILVDPVVGNENHVIICDFGLAFVANQDLLQVKALKKSKIQGLSLGYASPEVLNIADGEWIFRNESDMKAADVYSFGVVTYSTLCRLKPYILNDNCQRSADIKLAVLRGERPLIPQKQLPDHMCLLKELMMRCWDHDLKKRPTMAEVKKTIIGLKDYASLQTPKS